MKINSGLCQVRNWTAGWAAIGRQGRSASLPAAACAVLLLLFEEWLALRWRDACVRAEALEQFLTVVGAARLAEGAEP